MIFMEKDVFSAKPKQEENQIHKLLRLSAFSKEVRKKKSSAGSSAQRLLQEDPWACPESLSHFNPVYYKTPADYFPSVSEKALIIVEEQLQSGNVLWRHR